MKTQEYKCENCEQVVTMMRDETKEVPACPHPDNHRWKRMSDWDKHLNFVLNGNMDNKQVWCKHCLFSEDAVRDICSARLDGKHEWTSNCDPGNLTWGEKLKNKSMAEENTETNDHDQMLVAFKARLNDLQIIYDLRPSEMAEILREMIVVFNPNGH